MADITGIDVIYLADDAISIRDEMLEAVQTKCTCSGFVLQYDGCICDRGKKLSKATERSKVFLKDCNG